MLLKIGILLITNLSFGVNAEDLYGKWYTLSNEQQYMELWFNEEYAMTYQSAVNEFNLYQYEIDKKAVHFKLVESYHIDSHTFTIRIKKLKAYSMYSISVGKTANPEKLQYYKITDQPPEILSTLEQNEKMHLTEVVERSKKLFEAY